MLVPRISQRRMWSIRILFLLSLTFSLGSFFSVEQNEDVNEDDDSQETEEDDGDEGRELDTLVLL